MKKKQVIAPLSYLKMPIPSIPEAPSNSNLSNPDKPVIKIEPLPANVA